jgi:hypothetical protein
MSKDGNIFILGIPTKVWISSSVAIVIGTILLAVSHSNIFNLPLSWREIIRDMGISFIVAGTVSCIYEWSTRASEDKHKMTSLLRTVMGSFVPDDVWNEVNNEVFHRMVVRCNMSIKIKLYAHGVDFQGNKCKLPGTQMMLESKARYELHGLSRGSCTVDITHYLDEHMRIKEMNLPRFTKVIVQEPGCNKPREYKTNEEIQSIYNAELGCIHLSGGHGVRLFPINEDRPAILVVERLEIVNSPGVYTVVMPEMVMRGKEVNRPVIDIKLEECELDNLIVSVQTWSQTPNRDFQSIEENKHWKFEGLMLPGQGFSIVFRK